MTMPSSLPLENTKVKYEKVLSCSIAPEATIFFFNVLDVIR